MHAPNLDQIQDVCNFAIFELILFSKSSFSDNNCESTRIVDWFHSQFSLFSARPLWGCSNTIRFDILKDGCRIEGLRVSVYENRIIILLFFALITSFLVMQVGVYLHWHLPLFLLTCTQHIQKLFRILHTRSYYFFHGDASRIIFTLTSMKFSNYTHLKLIILHTVWIQYPQEVSNQVTNSNKI